jgi:radical SAM superfamily enzyme YgiQ (UPF0313 family)
MEVWMGVESGSQKILDAMEKGTTVEQIYEATRQLHAHGVKVAFFLQFGYPGEQWADIEKTIQLVRGTRPDDIGVSLSYPLPNTRFHDRVREQLGRKHNWDDSDDLCVMFKGAYTDDFYRTIRDALHAEVESWTQIDSSMPSFTPAQLWKKVAELEPISRNSDATLLPPLPDSGSVGASFVSINQLAARGGD